jgi:hypothetical protein
MKFPGILKPAVLLMATAIMPFAATAEERLAFGATNAQSAHYA